MVSQRQGLVLNLNILHSFLFTLSLFLMMKSSMAEDCGGIVTYWGQNNNEGTLQETCSNGTYKYVIINFLRVDETTTHLDLTGHCTNTVNDKSSRRLNDLPNCKALESEIQYCQSQNIKVFISVGFGLHTQSSSSLDTSDLAKSIYDNFLGGDVSGPLGKVSLDGVDLTDYNNVDLASEIKSFADRKIYFFAAVDCTHTYWIDSNKVATFDYVISLTYHEPSCAYKGNGDESGLLGSWETWTTSFPNSKVFLGLPASESKIGYINPDTFKNDILPVLKESSGYGGVMVFDRVTDKETGYSDMIKESVNVCPLSPSRKFYGLLRQY